jgi:hypothetical protein
MNETLKEKVEQTLKRLDDIVEKQGNLEKAERLNDRYSEIEPDPFHYSIEQAIGLPSYDKK